MTKTDKFPKGEKEEKALQNTQTLPEQDARNKKLWGHMGCILQDDRGSGTNGSKTEIG